jgi:hypothetical protein
VSDRATLPSVRNYCQGSTQILAGSVAKPLLRVLTERGGSASRHSGRHTRTGREPEAREEKAKPEAERQLESTVQRRLQLAHSRCTDMKDHTTNPDVRKTLRDLLIRVLRTIGSKIFRTDDCLARDRAWQIIPRRGGLSRTYRDPRFDYLMSCQACDGRGHDRDRIACSHCHGSGRAVLDRASSTQPRQGQHEWGRL